MEYPGTHCGRCTQIIPNENYVYDPAATLDQKRRGESSGKDNQKFRLALDRTGGLCGPCVVARSKEPPPGAPRGTAAIRWG